ncbi:MAG: cupin domain-containing protein [Terriglobia bacterium]
MTRREMNLASPLMLAALLADGSASILKADAPSARPNAQDHMRNAAPDAIKTLIQEPLAKMAKPVVAMITLTMPPGAASSPHKHTGPVFAYLLEGEIENQIEPNPPQRYKPGDFFYEPPMHVHRVMRNLSATNIAKLLIVQVEEQGVPFTIHAL